MFSSPCACHRRSHEKKPPLVLMNSRCSTPGLRGAVAGANQLVRKVSPDWYRGASLPPCPKDWIWTNGKCYFFSHKKKTWNQSQKFCESYDGNLAIILDQNTLHTIRHYKTIDDSWIGLRKSNGIWSWVNGSRFSRLLLSLAQDIPGLHCAYLNMDKYGILDCTSMCNWICTRNSSFSITEFAVLVACADRRKVCAIRAGLCNHKVYNTLLAIAVTTLGYRTQLNTCHILS
ncbi:C-type lectin domain family 2 member D-like isoform X2 [Pleurodeles waltl]|uniref:C-type lectin domain family 2 member D-like isoform X2 n=1 Tax=Pleurodeles waltl TaxID=8319 RepID=UPI003709773B